MIRLALLLTWLGLSPLWAQDYPALHSVTGVAAEDVLNVRERPDAGSPILATLEPDATGIEVLWVAEGWARVNTQDGAGYAALRFLRREPGPAWNTLERPLFCAGTEPFWSLDIDPAARGATFRTPADESGRSLPILQDWPGSPWAPVAGMSLSEGFAVLTPAECSDGMSDFSYGIRVDLFLNGPDDLRLSGCCQITPP